MYLNSENIGEKDNIHGYKKLDRWASLLLDTGKRNNLVNFKDTKASTVEIFRQIRTSFSQRWSPRLLLGADSTILIITV